MSASPDLVLSLPARAENVAVVRHAFGGLGEALSMPEQLLSDIKLAVTEACTNVVIHAYADAEGPMEIRAALGDVRAEHRRARRGTRRRAAGGLPRARPRPAAHRHPDRVAGARDGEDDATEVRMTFRIEG